MADFYLRIEPNVVMKRNIGKVEIRVEIFSLL